MTPAGTYFIIIFLLIAVMLLFVFVNNNIQLRTEKFIIGNTNDLTNKYIIPAEQLAVVQGFGLPTGPIAPVGNFDHDPSISSADGDPNSPSQMFMMAYNKSSPSCCPSPYSTSGGCVCLEDKQINLIQQRGNNNRFSKCNQQSEY